MYRPTISAGIKEMNPIIFYLQIPSTCEFQTVLECIQTAKYRSLFFFKFEY